MTGNRPGRKPIVITDRAVKIATDKTWPEWFAILDRAGAKTMSHKEIVAHLLEHYQIGRWWQQSVTVRYEQARGLRAKNELPSGFQISASRTMAVPVARLFRAWAGKAARARWLADPDFAIRKRSENKNLRVTWGDGKTSLSVDFYPKGEAKTRVVVQHSKLKSAAQAAKMKKYWAAALDALQSLLE